MKTPLWQQKLQDRFAEASNREIFNCLLDLSDWNWDMMSRKERNRTEIELQLLRKEAEERLAAWLES